MKNKKVEVINNKMYEMEEANKKYRLRELRVWWEYMKGTPMAMYWTMLLYIHTHTHTHVHSYQTVQYLLTRLIINPMTDNWIFLSQIEAFDDFNTISKYTPANPDVKHPNINEIRSMGGWVVDKYVS